MFLVNLTSKFGYVVMFRFPVQCFRYLGLFIGLQKYHSSKLYETGSRLNASLRFRNFSNALDPVHDMIHLLHSTAKHDDEYF